MFSFFGRQGEKKITRGGGKDPLIIPIQSSNKGGESGDFFRLTIRNEGSGPARDVTWHLDEYTGQRADPLLIIHPGEVKTIDIPLDAREPLRSRPIKNPVLVLRYRDEQDRPWETFVHILQVQRKDGLFHLRFDLYYIRRPMTLLQRLIKQVVPYRQWNRIWRW